MDTEPVGRNAEITRICTLLSAASSEPSGLLITGDPGIGKTVVWRQVIRVAGQTSRVLSCQPASAEQPLAFSALGDLFGEVADGVLPALPGPRRRALETALLFDPSPQSEPTDLAKPRAPSPERHMLARGTLDMLRLIARERPLVIAVDDAQWLDRPSAGVLEFCLRRLQNDPVSILVTCSNAKAAGPLGLARALLPDRLGRLQLGPLSLAAIAEILRSRLGIRLPRYILTRLYDTCGGNPLYALECARALLDDDMHVSVTSEPLPIPQSLSDLVRRHVCQVLPHVKRVGQLVAASSDPREQLIRTAYGDAESWAAIDQAIDAGIIARDGNTLRFTHPLLRSAIYAEMKPEERRNVHRRLGIAAEGTEERAWHLALAADRPSEDIATMLEGAATHAALRGAPEAAAALEEQSTRLTAAGQTRTARTRTVHAADYHFSAGNLTRSRELIQSALAGCPAGPPRASLLLRLATIYYHQSGWPLAEQTFHEAAKEAREDPALRAHAEQELAFARMVAGDLASASCWAKTSMHSAQQAATPALVTHSLARIAAFEFLQGKDVRLDLLEDTETLASQANGEPPGRLPLFGPSHVVGIILKWCDRLDEARLRLADRYQHALNTGDEASLPFLLYHLSELECWAGNWDAAEEYALEGCRVAEECQQQTMIAAPLYSLALVRAHQGLVQDASDLASQSLDVCTRTGNAVLTSLVHSVLGFVSLSLEDPQAVHTHLGHLAGALAGTGLAEPSVAKFLPDEIEALAALGEIDAAWALTRQLEKQGRLQGRHWAIATGARCRAHLAAASGDIDDAQAACQQALSTHAHLPMPFELGRTLLTTGAIQRRAKRKSAARQSLDQALAIFEHLGAPLWAAKAHQELSKIATRAPDGGLTGTEQRVAALVSQGCTNREIACAMFVTENTVQTHIRHIFQKLAVRSRTELAARLLSVSASEPGGTRPAAIPRQR